ncbi:hypothetical protein [Thermodesulforhabdus norvegica]|uniref:Uncharacterized protein n=1 Tax=Thermodesulforhabdus norvegica TaxID=39841 RepID=A0A1I4VDN4_9BACT|nr:hypothetical protein [Thermodesulforhabdus norvegica]SFM99266.1 hypothetical protein SAMN05660836_02232 [Thermodesulforhabdus norvegica]
MKKKDSEPGKSIPRLQQIMLISALRRKDIRRTSTPLYRLLGVFESRITREVLKPGYIEGRLAQYQHLLESAGYAKWKVVLWEKKVGFLFAQDERKNLVELMYEKVKEEIAPLTGWLITVVIHDPDGDIPLKQISTSRCKCIRARGPIRGDVYLHEIAAELFYRPHVPANITPERMMEDMGTGRFRSTMATLERALRVLEESGWVVVVKTRWNLPAMALTAEGYRVARALGK